MSDEKEDVADNSQKQDNVFVRKVKGYAVGVASFSRFSHVVRL